MNPTTSSHSILLQRTTAEIITMEIDESSSESCDTVVNVGSSDISPQQLHKFSSKSLQPCSPSSSQAPAAESKFELTHVLCIEQVESDFTPIPWRTSTQRGQFSCEKDERGRYVIRQPPELDYLFQFVVGVASMFIVPCIGIIIFISIFFTMEFNLTVSSGELTINTFGAYWKNKRLETSMSVPIRNIAALRVVMNQTQKREGLPDGKLFIITRDNLTIEVQKDYVNYYSVLAMAQKATEVINSNLNLSA
ncbi:predicted protein [Naegleria gruberi]|uniref:Predicted protein n=1 Tax=Naegleria gruberi TaxID=5762 RepID=D2VFL7_NAEGR|nr:uncharacterized protein NAEGRDRAFT_67669 [Naegleria gruberi]EFC44381.1 predicted protein [Naegleria gruberi]|eukprot:XP_002677125.1 predicted protein [Naegleria gruberi strain NEG-M]